MDVYNIDTEYCLLISTVCTESKRVFAWVFIPDPILTLDVCFFARTHILYDNMESI